MNQEKKQTWNQFIKSQSTKELKIMLEAYQIPLPRFKELLIEDKKRYNSIIRELGKRKFEL